LVASAVDAGIELPLPSLSKESMASLTQAIVDLEKGTQAINQISRISSLNELNNI